MTAASKLYPFFRANIHERRFAARLFRSMPFLAIYGFLTLIIVACFTSTPMLLAICAFLNVSIWLWIVSSTFFSLYGMYVASYSIDNQEPKSPPVANNDSGAGGSASEEKQSEVKGHAADSPNLTHAIVIANYKEDEQMLEETLTSLAQANGAKNICIMLAMEAREQGSEAKALRLQDKFGRQFAKLTYSIHPGDLQEQHLDGSADGEVAGKASNVRYAVARLCDMCMMDDSLEIDNMMLTIMDADVVFHPSYFSYISNEYDQMKRSDGEQHKWTMWQAPQLPFRNFYESPLPSRVWGYLSSVYEAGGISGLMLGGGHMVFSAYSVPLKLAQEAQLWDGDIVAEDHHVFVKGLLYSFYHNSVNGNTPVLQVRPVMLPAKSTSVISDKGYWATWAERWEQQKRHCQGIAEFSYLMLATWDLLTTQPLQSYTLRHTWALVMMFVRFICMHLLGTLQAIALALVTLRWLYNHRTIPECPDHLDLHHLDFHPFSISEHGGSVLCGLAGAWALVWPVVIVYALCIAANVAFLYVAFIRPAKMEKTNKLIWASESGGIVPTFGSEFFTVLCMVTFDIIVMFGPVMGVYGVPANLISSWNVMLRGNIFKYVTATKASSASIDSATSYGTMNKPKDDATLNNATTAPEINKLPAAQQTLQQIK